MVSLLEKMKANVSVDTVKFILFLYIQQVHKISLRESLVGGEEYPFLECSDCFNQAGI